MNHPATAPTSRPLLVTGASGFLGWHLCRAAQGRWSVAGTYHRHCPPLPGVGLHAIDLTEAAAVVPWLEALSPAAVIHTAALAQPNRCQQHPDTSYALNVTATRLLAQWCAQRQIPFVFTSTDQVFDGQSAPYSEADPPHPINLYGRHKAEAEALISALNSTAAVCRLPLLYGPPSPTAECFLQGFLRTLRAGQPLSLFTDEYRSPAYVEDAAAGLLLALEKATGLLHLGGPDRLSRYEFGLHLAEVFGLDKGLLVPGKQADVAMPAPRPADVSSDSRRALALGYRPRSVVAGLEATRSAMARTEGLEWGTG